MMTAGPLVEFAALMHQASLPFVVLDATGCFLAVNRAAEQLYGSTALQLLATPFATVVDEFSRDKAALMVDQTLASGPVSDWELNHPQPSGPPVLVSYAAWSWRPAPDQSPVIAAVGQSLSAAVALAAQLATTNQQLEGALLQLERAHAALKEAQAQLVRSEKLRALGQLVAGVAHEVNTPLAFVANNLDFLAESLAGLRHLHQRYHELVALSSPTLTAHLQTADAEAAVDQLWADLDDLLPESREGLARIAAIVQALRVFAHPDSPGVQSTDLNASLASTVRIARASAPRELRLVEHYGPLQMVVCNPGQVNQIVLNLLTNAIQSITGPGEVRISSEQQDALAVITIQDTGVGMDATTLARLGEPFFTTRPLGSGTGLGIAISRGIAERHGGRLEFQSAPGQGTTARLLLPINGPR